MLQTKKTSKKTKKRAAAEVDAPAYTWSLKHFIETLTFDYIMEGIISYPSKYLTTDLSSLFVQAALNSSNCFDFDYQPANGDTLTIRNTKNGNYIAYIFENGKWTDGQHDVFSTVLKEFEAGVLEIEEVKII